MALLYVRTSSAGTGPAVTLADLGIIIGTSATWTLLSASSPSEAAGSAGQFSARELRDSQNLFDAISNSDLEWSMDGAAVELAADYTADFMIMQDFVDDELDVAVLKVNGVDFSGHLNGGANKHDATEIDVEGTYAYISTAPGNLEAVISGINTQLGGVAANSFANVATQNGTAVADAAADTLTVQGADGIVVTASPGTDTVTISGTALLPRDGSRPMTGDLDMGANDITNVTTVDGRDVSVDGAALDSHLDGGANKHDATEIDVEGTYANIPGTPENLELAMSGINARLGSGIDHGGLAGLGDDDHSQYVLLSGNAARNPVVGELDISGGDLRLPVDGSAPTGATGRVSIVAGILCVYDATRTKWLSVDRKMVWASRNAGTATNIYLRGADGTPTSTTGFRVPRNATVTALTLAIATSATVTLEIRKNDSATVLASLVVTAAVGNQDVTVDLDVSAGDELQFFINGTCAYPTAGMEVAWRV